MAKSKLKINRTPGNRAVAYLRKSTDAQEASIDRQREAVYRYAAKHGYDVIGEYIDAGISGLDSSDRRPEWQRLIADAERGAFDFVLVWDLSRLSRSDPMETFAELRPIRRAGVKIASTDRDKPVDWDSFAGQLMLSIDAMANNEYVRKMARGTLDGQAKKARRGEWVAGRPPLGYVKGDGDRLVLGESQDVETIRLLFAKYAGGQSFRDLTVWLRTRGQERCISWVRQALMNRIYAGDFVWGRNCQAVLFSMRSGDIAEAFEQGQTAEEDQVIIPDNHPAIIDRELFDAVQRMFALRRRGTTPHKQGGGFILSGLLRCADCGFALIGHTDHNTGKKWFRCGGHNTRGQGFCHSHLVTQDEVLAAVLQAFEAKFDAKAVKLARAELERELNSRKSETREGRAVERSLAKVEAKLDKAAARLVEVDTDLMPVVQGQIRKLRDEKEKIEKELQRVRKPAATILLDFDQRVKCGLAAVKQLRDAMNTKDATALRNYLNTTIKEIKVQVTRKPHGKRWRYSFSDGEIVLHQNADLFSSW